METSRLIMENEFFFHIFYYLLIGSDSKTKQRLNLALIDEKFFKNFSKENSNLYESKKCKNVRF